MIVATPRSPFTFTFDVERDGVPLGSFQHRAFQPHGEAVIDGVEHPIQRVARSAWTIGPEERSEKARVEMVPRLRRIYRLSWRGGSLEMSRSMFGFQTSLVREGGTVGSISTRDLFTRTLVAEMPDDVPREAVLIGLWITVRATRRFAAG